MTELEAAVKNDLCSWRGKLRRFSVAGGNPAACDGRKELVSSSFTWFNLDLSWNVIHQAAILRTPVTHRRISKATQLSSV